MYMYMYRYMQCVWCADNDNNIIVHIYYILAMLHERIVRGGGGEAYSLGVRVL